MKPEIKNLPHMSKNRCGQEEEKENIDGNRTTELILSEKLKEGKGKGHKWPKGTGPICED